MVKRKYVPATRYEAGLQAYLSLYSVEGDCWPPVTFRSEREATEAAHVVNCAGRCPESLPFQRRRV
jgi:hypothetical protein